MATVLALKACYCGTPTALREPGDQFEYVGPKASYLELIEGEWNVLPLPAADAADPLADADEATRSAIEDQLRPVSDEHVHEPPATDPLDHDGDGKKGGTAADERKEVIAALKAKKVKFFAGAPTDKLKEILAAS